MNIVSLGYGLGYDVFDQYAAYVCGADSVQDKQDYTNDKCFHP